MSPHGFGLSSVSPPLCVVRVGLIEEFHFEHACLMVLLFFFLWRLIRISCVIMWGETCMQIPICNLAAATAAAQQWIRKCGVAVYVIRVIGSWLQVSYHVGRVIHKRGFMPVSLDFPSVLQGSWILF